MTQHSHASRPQLRSTLRRTAAGVLTVGAIVAAPMASTAPAQARAACYSDDGVAVTNQGVTAGGVLHWYGARSGSYNITVSNTRDGIAPRLVVDFFKHGVGWIDRRQYNGSDGVTGYTGTVGFSKDYQVDKVRFGVVGQGSRVLDLVFDTNSACGA